MNLYEVKDRNPRLVDHLVTVWENSVRATHHFLSNEEVKKIKEYVSNALMKVAHLIEAESFLNMEFAITESRGSQ